MMKQLAKTIGLLVMAGGTMNCLGGDQLGPATCKEAKAAYGVATDGAQTLYIEGDKARPWSAYCAGMASDEPVEFLELPRVSPEGDPVNYSKFSELITTASQNNSFEIETQYEKVRIDPVALTIDITDNAFATTTIAPEGSGHVSAALEQEVGFMPYGAAMQCGQMDSIGLDPTVASVDLTGLPFELAVVQFCDEVGDSKPIADSAAPTKIVELHAVGTGGAVPGETSPEDPAVLPAPVTCGRASVRCLPHPTVNGQVDAQKTIQLRYQVAAPGLGF